MRSIESAADGAIAAERPDVRPGVPGQQPALHARMIIHGCATEAATSARYAVYNPANGTIVGTAPLGAADDARRATAAAEAALGDWRARPVGARAEALQRGLEAVAASSYDLAVLLTREQGKPLGEATGEIDSFLDRMRAFIRVACAGGGRPVPILPSFHDQDRRITEASACVTVGLVAWNFPVGLLAKKMGPTLLMGGTVVLKPAFTAPLTASRVVELMNGSGIPAGVINCVTGRGDEIGQALVADPGVGRVHLTGSDDTGKRIKRAARTHEQELFLNLSGSDAMIVCADADLERAVHAAVAGRYHNAGQACIAVKRLYVASAVWNEFLKELCRGVKLREPGDGLTPAALPQVRMGPLHTAETRARLEEQLADAERQGANVVVGGSRPNAMQTRNGHFFEPTLVTGVSPHSRLVTEEVFGPVLPVLKARDLEDAVEQANNSPWDLNTSIWTSDRDAVRRIAGRVRCRQLWVNRLPLGSPRPA